MSYRSRRLASGWLWLSVAAALAGCERKSAEPPPPKPPIVTVRQPVERPVVDYGEFTGRTEAIESVEIRARVNGYLDKIRFKPGGEVKQGEPLFEIDPRPYQADLDKAQGEVTRAQARLERLAKDLERARRAGTAVSREELDKIVGDRAEAEATVKSAMANVSGAKLNLNFTTITTPISGRVSRPLLTVGNLIKADSTLLTTVVSQGQMYAYFDVDENTMLRYEKMVREGKLKPRKEEEPRVLLRLANETGFPHEGTVDFIETQLTKGTGTIQVRASFPNADGILKPGEFVDIRIPLGEPHKALLIPESAVGADQGQNYVFVVDEQNQVAYRRVKLGTVHDGERVVEEGVKAGDWVVVKGLQRVRDGVTVAAERETAKPPN